jgi:integrase/recombinase XerD
MKQVSGAPSIGDFIAAKLTKGEIAPKTAKLYKAELERFQVFLNSREPPVQIYDAGKNDIVHFLSQLRTSNLVNSTKRKLASIKEFYKYLRQEGYRPDNPTETIVLGASPRRSEELVILSRAEMQTLLNAPDGDLGLRDKALMHFYYSGPRRSEGLSVSVHDVELEERQVRVAGRVVPLKKEAVDAIAAYIQVRPTTKENALFLTRTNTPLGHRQAWYIAKKYIHKCGLNNKANLESLRASYAVHAMEDGVWFVDMITALGSVDSPWLRQLAELARTHSKPGPQSEVQKQMQGPDFASLLHPKVREASFRHYEDGDYREAVLNGMLALTETIR